MARKKVKKAPAPKKQVKKAKPVKKRKTAPMDPNVEEIYEKEITFNCPQRGLVKQKVKVKKYKTKIVENPHIIGPEEDQMEPIGDDLEPTEDIE